jgi:anoctamin-10
VLRSSYRQTIVDFIISSRIRDSGAELGENTNLGKEIQMRVPLHMPATLERLYVAWVTFWFEENWKGRDGRSMSVIPVVHNSSVCGQVTLGRLNSPSSASSTVMSDGRSHVAPSAEPERVPHAITRFVLGSFFQPLDSIQQYFGEGVAFYFAWQQHCAVHLVFLSVIGLAVSIVLLRSGSWDHPIRPAFSFIIMIWSFVVMVTWRQRQTYLAHRWGTLNYQEEETTRPQHFGAYQQCPITKEWTIHYPVWKRWMKYIISFNVVFIITAGTLYVVMVLFSNRDNFLCMYKNNNLTRATIQFNLFELWDNSSCKTNSASSNSSHTRVNGPSSTSPQMQLDFHYWLINFQFPAVMALGLPLLNFALMRLAIALTEFENYRTESEYRNQLIIKVFAFRFVCYFASLYWYSFKKVSESLDSYDGVKVTEIINDTIFTVAFMLMVSLTVSHWWNLLLTIFIPQWFHRWRLYEHKKKIVNEIRLIEEMQEENLKMQEAGVATVESMDIKLVNCRILLLQAQSNVWLETMLPEHVSFQDYVYVVIQFAFVTCFSIMLPIAPLISLLNHLWGMRLDAYKLCRGRRRPIVQRAGGIGVWEHVVSYLIFLVQN